MELGILAQMNGDPAAALRQFKEAEALGREVGDRAVLGQALRMLGTWFAREGDLARAESLYREALTTLRQLGERWFTPRCLLALAGLAAERQEHRRAVRLIGAADAMIGAIGGRLYPADLAQQEAILTGARAGLGEAAFAVAWAEGQATSRAQAVAYALQGDAPSI
jgi:hypothetical protein